MNSHASFSRNKLQEVKTGRPYKRILGVLCATKVPLKLMRIVFRTTLRLVVMYEKSVGLLKINTKIN
jgi:hypothetical protein